MCDAEGGSQVAMLEDWVLARSEVLQQEQQQEASAAVGRRAAAAAGRSATAPEESGAAEAAAAAEAADFPEALLNRPCPFEFDAATTDGALEWFGFARAEIDCTEDFIQATITYGRHLVSTKGLSSYDLMHEVIRAETGYRLARLSGRHVSERLFDEFMQLQQELAEVLQGWALWEYEFTHWRYHKRPHGGDDYAQLYNPHRLPEYQHLECPATPLAYRMWANFPTCPPTRLRDLPRFSDAYVSAMTVDNWRAGFRDFLSEGYNYNVSFFAGGDPTMRLSKGAHSIFAGVFIQKLPTDLWCYQQVIHDLRPQYIVDLGSSQGGSAVWFASMLKLFEIPGGKVISVDLALEQAYWLSKGRAEAAAKRLKVEKYIDWNYVAGGSKNPKVREKVTRLCAKAPCMVVSDSEHDFSHTYHEMEWYAKHVGVGQYLIVEDTNIYGWSGWMNINDPNKDGLKKGPMEAANDFDLSHRADFARTDWCAKHYGMSQTQNGWFFRHSWRAKGLVDKPY